jgi:hypothetical protein
MITDELTREFPKYKLVMKQKSKLMKFMYFFIKPISPAYMTDFITVIGYTVYMPEIYIGTIAGAGALVHERQHMRDYRKFGILYLISYLFLLPSVFSFRAMWEWRGYRESMKFNYAWFGMLPQDYLERIVEEFTSARYLWMFPFKKIMRGIVTRAAAQIKAELVNG